MLAEKVSQKFLVESLGFLNGHSSRSLRSMVMTLLRGNCQLTVTSLGRNIRGDAKVKSKIKRADDFLNNGIIYGKLPQIYGAVAKQWLKLLSTAVIAIDWSDSCTGESCLLTASLVYQGRSIPLYQEIHPANKEENAIVHLHFLRQLKTIIPAGVEVILVTDAGFKTTWFQEVRNQGWDFVGRVRGNIQCKLDENKEWTFVNELHRNASFKVKDLGDGWLSKTSSTRMRGHFYIYKEHPKGRKKHKQKGKPLFPDQEKRYKKMNAEPWVIFTSLDETKLKSMNIIYIYKKRMQIEQNFRDLKNQRNGFSLRYSRTKDIVRLAMLCLVANLATIILWFIGFSAERQNYHFSFQANTVKTHRVLSFITLGKQVLMHNTYLSMKNITESINVLAIDYNDKVIYA